MTTTLHRTDRPSLALMRILATRIGSGLWQALVQIGRTLTMLPQALAARNQIEALSRLSDAELARHGIRREDIGRHVIERHFPNL